MPLLESIAAGLNPISTDVGFVRDIFEYFKISEKFIYTSEDEVIELVNSLRLNSSQRIDHNRTLIKNLSFENLGKSIQSSFDI
jgi:glycosyltransferase involved in cell wall biosynthesis